MSGTVKLSGAALAVALAGWLWFGRGGEFAESAETGTVDARSALATGAEEAGANASDGARVHLDPSEADRVPLEPPTAAPPRQIESATRTLPPAIVRASFVDDVDGLPLAGVELEARHGADGWTATSDRYGQVELSVPAFGREDWTQELRASAGGRADAQVTAMLRAGGTSTLGELRLLRGFAVRGRVLDLAGRGVEAARVQVEPAELPRWWDEGVWHRHGPREAADRRVPDLRSPHALCSADGRFHVGGIAPGAFRLWASAEGMRYAWTAPLEAVGGETLEGVEIALEPLRREDRIAARVLDPEGGPVPGAWILVRGEAKGPSSMDWLTADEDGRFELVVRQLAPHTITARDGLDRWGDAGAENVQPGTLDLVLQLQRPRAIEIRVRDENGESIAGFHLSTLTADELVAIAQPTRIRAPGMAELVLPALSFLVEVRAPGYHSERQGPFVPASAPDTLEITLRPLPAVAGRVLADGLPVAGAKVELALAYPGWNVAAGGFRSRSILAGYGQALTDAEGRFRVLFHRDGEYYVRAEAQGRAPGELGPLFLGASSTPDDLTIELARGGAIEGRVLLPAGRDAAGTIVGLNRGDGRPRTQRAGPDGWFRFEHLAPGHYQITRRSTEFDRWSASTGHLHAGTPIQPSCEVQEGRTTRFDLDLGDSGD